MKNLFKFNITGWHVLAALLAYIFVMNLFFDYVISREVDSLVQLGASFIALIYTVWQVQIIISYINKTIKTKEK
jgi:nitrogen fixation protein FixH